MEISTTKISVKEDYLSTIFSLGRFSLVLGLFNPIYILIAIFLMIVAIKLYHESLNDKR